MTDNLLFSRNYKIVVDTIEIQKPKVGPGLTVIFNVVKTVKKEPNTCDLTVLNLNPDHRAQLAAAKTPWVSIEAGYDSFTSMIFRGQVRTTHSFKDGSDWVTELSTGDGEKSLKNARINKSYAKGTGIETVINDLVDQLGLGTGNAKKKSRLAKWAEGGKKILNGLVVSGSVKTELDGILKSAGLEWSVQDGELQFLETGKPLEGLAHNLSAKTGLIGSPTIGSDGLAQMQSLLNGTIIPGGLIKLKSRELPVGFYRSERCEYIGNTAGDEWYVNIEGKAI